MSPREAAATAQHYPVSVGGRGTEHTMCYCGAAWVCAEWQATVVVPAVCLSRTLIAVGAAWMLAGGIVLAAFATPLDNWLACPLLLVLVAGVLVLARRWGAL